MPDRLIEAINDADDRVSRTSDSPDAAARSNFHKHHRDLVALLAPVTADSLRATSDEHGRVLRGLTFQPVSEAKIWSRKLWVLTALAAAFILLSENTNNLLHEFPPDAATAPGIQRWRQAAFVLQSIDPFIYGALGALAYLLRTVHESIYQRTFDRLRTPDYYNRILLGMVSGGAIQLFITGVTTDDAVVEISAAAVAFLAGYNSDVLFATLERVFAAILPRVGVDTLRRPDPALRATQMAPQLIQLLDRYAQADEPGKKLLEPLIGKLAERL